jgi:mycofactocin precursor
MGISSPGHGVDGRRQSRKFRVMDEPAEQTRSDDRPSATPAVDDLDPSSESVAADEELVVDDLLVEEISIDGMCGVY